MYLLVKSNYELKKVDEAINELLAKGELVTVSYDVWQKPKTKKQLGLIFGWLLEDIYKDALERGEYRGDNKNFEKNIILKSELYSMFSSYIVSGKNFTIGMSDMTKEQMKEFINNIIDWCDEYEIILRPEIRYTWLNKLSPQEIEEAKHLVFPEKDEDYLRYIRKQPCILTGRHPNYDDIDAHHLKGIAGLGDKAPDWATLPIWHNEHVKMSGHITTNELEKELKHITQGVTLETFCKLCYQRYKEKK